LERPGWLRELGELPATVKGQRAWRQAVSRVEQYRERYGIIDPTGRSAQSLATWSWSSAATTAPPTRQSGASTSGSAPCVNDGATGTSAPTPTSHAPDPAEPISLA
jgi:hypothetical protein